MARGVGSGLGVVRTVRVIAVVLYIDVCMSQSSNSLASWAEVSLTLRVG